MINWGKLLITKILWDASWPERALRTIAFGLGEVLRTGQWVLPPKYGWVGGILQAAALFIPAGEKNPN
jgi:hypothetical protein